MAEVEAALPSGGAFAALRAKLKAPAPKRNGSSEPVLLHEGPSEVALSSDWSAALDPRLTHALGCALLACRAATAQKDQTTNPVQGKPKPCVPVLRWEASPGTPAAKPRAAKKAGKVAICI